MAERIDLLIRAALQAIALLYPSGKVSLIELGELRSQHEVVNVDVTGRADLREQIAEAIIACDVYHVHDETCFPWESWTTSEGVIWRGLVGKLLTMWVRVEEIIGYAPAASDPATAAIPVPTTIEQTWMDTGSGSGYEHTVTDPPTARPYLGDNPYSDQLREHLATAADAGALGIARVDGTLSEPPVWPPLAVPAAEPHPLAELLESPVPVVPGDDGAVKRWTAAAIKTELLRGGPFGLRTDALRAVLAHPAAAVIDQETALTIAECLVRGSVPRRPRWYTLNGILSRSAVAK